MTATSTAVLVDMNRGTATGSATMLVLAFAVWSMEPVATSVLCGLKAVQTISIS